MSENTIKSIHILDDDRESVKVLSECIALQRKKGRDYQSNVSPVRQADYYRLGMDSIYDMLHTKMLRILSLMAMAKESQDTPNFESMEDTLKDLINYASFGVAWLRGKVDGQDQNVDIFNRPMKKETFDSSTIPNHIDISNSNPIDTSKLSTKQFLVEFPAPSPGKIQ